MSAWDTWVGAAEERRCNSLIHPDKKQTLQIDVRMALCLPSRHLRNLKWKQRFFSFSFFFWLTFLLFEHFICFTQPNTNSTFTIIHPVGCDARPQMLSFLIHLKGLPADKSRLAPFFFFLSPPLHSLQFPPCSSYLAHLAPLSCLSLCASASPAPRSLARLFLLHPCPWGVSEHSRDLRLRKNGARIDYRHPNTEQIEGFAAGVQVHLQTSVLSITKQIRRLSSGQWAGKRHLGKGGISVQKRMRFFAQNTHAGN